MVRIAKSTAGLIADLSEHLPAWVPETATGWLRFGPTALPKTAPPYRAR